MARLYVRTSGNDTTGNGTLALPWASLFKATQGVLNSGDIIDIGEGTYNENFSNSLSLPVGVSIEGAGSTLTIINTITTTDFQCFLILESATENTPGNQHISGIYFNGLLTTSISRCIWVRGRGLVNINNCRFENYKHGVIFDGRLTNPNNNPPTAPPIYHAVGNQFHDNIMNNCSFYFGQYGSGCLNIGGQQDMLVFNNSIIQNQRPNGQNGWPIKYSLDGYNKNLKIYNNTLIKNKFLMDYAGAGDWPFAIELWHCDGGVEIYNNNIEGELDIVHTNKNGYAYGAYIHHNNITQPVLNDKYQGGILFEKGGEGIIVDNNYFNNLASCVIILSEYFGEFDTPLNIIRDVRITNNLMTNVGRLIGNGNNGTAFAIVAGNETIPADVAGGLSSIDVDDIYFEHNTVVAAPGNAPFFGIGLRFDESPGNVDNINVKNNIVIGFDRAWIRTSYPPAHASTWNGFNLQNNLLFNNFQNNLPDSILWTLPLTGYVNTGNILSIDPLLTTNYTLNNGSPAINTATDGTNIGHTGGTGGANIPPTVNAGTNQTITLPTNSVTLSGSASDTDGTIVSHIWTLQSGPNTPTIVSPNNYTTSVTGLIQGVYNFLLTATDDLGLNGLDSVQITVNPLSGGTTFLIKRKIIIT